MSDVTKPHKYLVFVPGVEGAREHQCSRVAIEPSGVLALYVRMDDGGEALTHAYAPGTWRTAEKYPTSI